MSSLGGKNNAKGGNQTSIGGPKNPSTSLGQPKQQGTSIGGKQGSSLGGGKNTNTTDATNETPNTNTPPNQNVEITKEENKTESNVVTNEVKNEDQTNVKVESTNAPQGSSLGGGKQGSSLGGKGGATLGGKQGTNLGGGQPKKQGGATLGGKKDTTKTEVNNSNDNVQNAQSGDNIPKTEGNVETPKTETNTSNDSVQNSQSGDNIPKENAPTGGKKGKKGGNKKDETTTGEPPKEDTKTTGKKGTTKKGPPVPKHIALIKKQQEEMERRKQEEERLKKEEEERERLRVIREKEEEERKKKQAEERKIRREQEKEKRKLQDQIKARDEAMKKYGFSGVPQSGTGIGVGGVPKTGKKSKMVRNKKPGQNKPQTGENKDIKTEKNDEEVKENWDDDDNVPKESKVENISISVSKSGDNVGSESITKDSVEISKSGNVKDSSEIKKSDDVRDHWDEDDNVQDNWDEIKEEVPDTWDDKDTDDNIKDSTEIKEDVETPVEEGLQTETKKSKLELQKEREEKQKQLKEERDKLKEENLTRVKNKLRAPICCVMGHVDTGKTLLLDKMRNTNVQAQEAGGITQQIGATFFPLENLRKMTKSLNEKLNLEFKIPGLLVIDTPGHASFTNLRTRGSSLCDISILVIDIMKGIEVQTKESLSLLRKKNTPFIVALNKVDRIHGWKSCPNTPIRDALKVQSEPVLAEFDTRVRKTEADLAGESLNACLYYKNKDIRKNISLVPTSAMHGEGIPDLLMLLIQLTQKHMTHRLTSKNDKVECTVLEVKKLPGIGTTIDVILANGTLKVGDQIVLAGLNGKAIVTHIKSLLTPPEMKELRVKNQYQKNSIMHAAMGLKITAHSTDLDDAVAGSQLFVVQPGDDINEYCEIVQEAVENLSKRISKSETGVYVQASTLGSMEALLEFLCEDCKIPVAAIRIGPVHKKDVMIASVMHDRGRPEYACILAFDVEVTHEAEQFANQLNVRIFREEIIYRLETRFKEYLDDIQKRKEEEARRKSIFPCVLQFLPEHIYRDRDPIIAGVKVLRGVVKINTPLIIFKNKTDPVTNEYSEESFEIGKITSIERENKQLNEANVGDEVCINITPGQRKYSYARYFDEKDKILSYITRESLDALKIGYHDFCVEHFDLLVKLKKKFNIM